MHSFSPYIGPAIALLFIVRRGMTPRRIKPNGLWTFPVVITLLALVSLWHGRPPSLEAIAIFAVAIAAGAALGWFTTQHVELTLDDKTGTIMSKPTPIGTALTAGVFVARFAVEFYNTGGLGQGTHVPAVHEADNLLRLADAGLMFVAARGLARASHMWIRIQPMLAAHKAAQAVAPPPADALEEKHDGQ